MSLSYLLQITIVWVFAYVFYRWWLSSERMPRANRIFLLTALTAGPLLPLLPRPELSTEAELSPLLVPVRSFLIELETLTVSAENTVMNPLAALSWYHWVWLLGGLLWLGRMIHGWSHIFRLYRSGTRSREEGVIVIRRSGLSSPFSYGPLLFWNEDSDRESPEWKSVWEHERAHIVQGHSYDLLLNDLLIAVFWWHPLPHLYRNALRLQHEYLADAAAAGRQTRAYARMLLEHKVFGWVPAPGHAFHQSFIKNRITMLTQPKGAGWKLLAVLPLLLAIFWACEKEADLTGSSIAETEERMAANREADLPGKFETMHDTIVTYDPETFEETMSVVSRKVYLTVDQMPVYGNCAAELESKNAEELKNCSNLNLLTAVYESVKYPAAAKDAGLEGMVVASFTVPASGGDVQDLKIIKSSQPKDALPTAAEQAGYAGMDAAVLRAITEMPSNWTAGVYEGESVSVRFNLPVRFRLE